MKSIAFLLALATAALAAPAPNPQLAQVHKVYPLPMANGLDQYLASRLSAAGVFAVVADPTQADAVFTDRLGEAFESRLNNLVPKPKPPAAKPAAGEPAKPVAGEPAKPAAGEPAKPAAGEPAQPAAAAREEEPERQVPLSSFRRAKGTLFLVDVKTRAVVWSVYDRPQNATADEMNRAATRIVARLKHDLKGK
jgi:hypothetical protein